MHQFNIDRFRQLVEKEKTFKKRVKSFENEFPDEEDLELLEKIMKLFQKESPDEYTELFSYRNMIRDQSCFRNRWKYFSLIQDYKEKRIGDSAFGDLIFYQYHDDSGKTLERLEENLEELATLSIEAKSKGFSDLIYEISDLCHEMEDWLDLDDDEMSTKEFCRKVAESENKLQEIFVELQPYFQT